MQAMDWSQVQVMVLDMDGTLVNTEQVITQAASDTLVALGGKPLPTGYVMPNMFGTAADLMADVCADRGVSIPAGGKAQLGAQFEQFYAAHAHCAAPLYDGVSTCLQAARARGIRLAVCTNKQQLLAQQGLQAVGILDWMELVTGRDTYGVAKPSPLPLLHTLSALHVAPEHAVFVGDTHADAACAQAAGVHFWWFTAGFGTAQVRDYAIAGAFSHFDELRLQMESSSTSTACMSQK